MRNVEKKGKLSALQVDHDLYNNILCMKMADDLKLLSICSDSHAHTLKNPLSLLVPKMPEKKKKEI